MKIRTILRHEDYITNLSTALKGHQKVYKLICLFNSKLG